MDNNTTAANRAKRNNKKIVFWTIGAVLAAILIISNGVFAGWVVYKLNNRQNGKERGQCREGRTNDIEHDQALEANAEHGDNQGRN